MNFNCLFCDKRCTKPWFEADRWDCVSCNVLYWDHSQGTIICFNVKIKDKAYRLYINQASNHSYLNAFYDASGTIWDDEEKQIIKFDFILGQINPDNVQSKVQHMLTFL